jgi:hypothetical protein
LRTCEVQAGRHLASQPTRGRTPPRRRRRGAFLDLRGPGPPGEDGPRISSSASDGSKPTSATHNPSRRRRNVEPPDRPAQAGTATPLLRPRFRTSQPLRQDCAVGPRRPSALPSGTSWVRVARRVAQSAICFHPRAHDRGRDAGRPHAVPCEVAEPRARRLALVRARVLPPLHAPRARLSGAAPTVPGSCERMYLRGRSALLKACQPHPLEWLRHANGAPSSRASRSAR